MVRWKKLDLITFNKKGWNVCFHVSKLPKAIWKKVSIKYIWKSSQNCIGRPLEPIKGHSVCPEQEDVRDL